MRLSRLIVSLLIGAVSTTVIACGEGGVSEPAAPATPPTVGLIGDLLHVTGLIRCTPLPYDSVTRVIGPAGGTIAVGPHEFRVPAGALGSAVAITAVAPSGSVNWVRFQPEGLTFEYPASLTMSYANCNLLGLPIPPRIAYTEDAVHILEYLLSWNDWAARTVTGRVEHFSGYAVAW